MWLGVTCAVAIGALLGRLGGGGAIRTAPLGRIWWAAIALAWTLPAVSAARAMARHGLLSFGDACGSNRSEVREQSHEGAALLR